MSLREEEGNLMDVVDNSKKEYLLGIDIGTSACKVALFDKSGDVIGTADEEYPVYYPKPGWAEQNPDEWWQAVCVALKKLIADSKVTSDKIAGIGIDGQSWSAIPIDIEGAVLGNTPIWMDTRAADICTQLNKRIGEDNVFSLTGNSLQPSYTTAKILWYEKYQPEMYSKIFKILQSNSYIGYKLTGVISQDISQGYGIHCFDMRKGIWDLDMCEQLGIPSSFLPELYPCHEVIGGVTKEASKASGLAVGTPVVAGGLDAACGTLGAGVIHPGETQEQGGQAGGMSICLDEYKADPRLIMGYHVVPNCWLLQGGTTGGGGVMRWLEQELGDYERLTGENLRKSSLEIFNEIAGEVAPGSDGLVFLPYMAGERSPIWDPSAKGVYFGLDFKKTKGHLIRSAMEGVAFSLKHNIEVAKEIGAKVEVLRAMGGSANSLLWTQIKSDVTGLPIVVPSSDTATTLGAAILAGVGVGMYDSFEEAVKLTVKEKRQHQPGVELGKVYEKNYKVYIGLYDKLKKLMKEV